VTKQNDGSPAKTDVFIALLRVFLYAAFTFHHLPETRS
jgi:hypothetical protein